MSGIANKFSSYSMTQLNELLEDDDKLNTIVQEMEEMQEVQQTKEMILASNRVSAEQNLLMQPSLEEKKNQLTKRYISLQESFEAYQVHKSQLDQSSGNGSLDTLLALLQAEGAKIEEETENMADSFLDGDVTLDTFIDSYQNKRKLAHLRRVKIEKLQEMVLKGHQGPQVSSAQPEELPSRPSLFCTDATNHSEHRQSSVLQPRRAPPPPPTQQPPAVAPQPALLSYPTIPYPPIPPRTGAPLPSLNPGYPHNYMSPYPPPPPQRPAPRMAPPSGFMIQ